MNGTRRVCVLALDGLTEHAFVTLAPDGIITSWNVGAERLFGHHPERAVGVHVSTIFTPDDQGSGVSDGGSAARGSARFGFGLPMGDGTRSGIRKCVRATIVVAASRFALHGLRGIGPGSAESQRSRMTDGRSVRHLLVARLEDTTARLAESNARLATEIADRTQAEAARMRLLRRLVVAQEEERRRIARDLHDDLGQRLTALRLTLEAGSAKERRRTAGDAGPGARDAGAHRPERRFPRVGTQARGARRTRAEQGAGNLRHEWSRHAGVRANFHAAARHASGSRRKWKRASTASRRRP